MYEVVCTFSDPQTYQLSTPSSTLEAFQFSRSTCEYPDFSASASASVVSIDTNQFSLVSDYYSLGLWVYAILLFFVGYFVVRSMFER